jgi:hypothetical protein
MAFVRDLLGNQGSINVKRLGFIDKHRVRAHPRNHASSRKTVRRGDFIA